MDPFGLTRCSQWEYFQKCKITLFEYLSQNGSRRKICGLRTCLKALGYVLCLVFENKELVFENKELVFENEELPHKTR